MATGNFAVYFLLDFFSTAIKILLFTQSLPIRLSSF